MIRCEDCKHYAEPSRLRISPEEWSPKCTRLPARVDLSPVSRSADITHWRMCSTERMSNSGCGPHALFFERKPVQEELPPPVVMFFRRMIAKLKGSKGETK